MMIYFDFSDFRMALSVSRSFTGMTWSEPTPETVYRVHLVADERVFQVPTEALERWERNHGVRG
jgi:hypothetical protein